MARYLRRSRYLPPGSHKISPCLPSLHIHGRHIYAGISHVLKTLYTGGKHKTSGLKTKFSHPIICQFTLSVLRLYATRPPPLYRYFAGKKYPLLCGITDTRASSIYLLFVHTGSDLVPAVTCLLHCVCVRACLCASLGLRLSAR